MLKRLVDVGMFRGKWVEDGGVQEKFRPKSQGKRIWKAR